MHIHILCALSHPRPAYVPTIGCSPRASTRGMASQSVKATEVFHSSSLSTITYPFSTISYPFLHFISISRALQVRVWPDKGNERNCRSGPGMIRKTKGNYLGLCFPHSTPPFYTFLPFLLFSNLFYISSLFYNSFPFSITFLSFPYILHSTIFYYFL